MGIYRADLGEHDRNRGGYGKYREYPGRMDIAPAVILCVARSGCAGVLHGVDQYQSDVHQTPDGADHDPVKRPGRRGGTDPSE